tara:strand:+ start:9265 stop:10359 length:1095 start_codon:yes stop_codon:yes gene_type:complete
MMRVFDSDAHIMENELAWQFLPDEFHARRPVPIELPEDTSLTVFNAAWLIDEKVRLFGASPPIGARSVGKRYPIESQTLESIPARLADMDRANLDIQVIYPTFGLTNLCEDVTLEAELMKSYNSFVAGQVKQSGGRMLYAAMVPFRNPDAAVKEIRRVAEMGGVASIFMRGLEWDRPISDPSFYPIYAEAEKHNLPIGVHIGSGSPALREMFRYQKRIPGEEPFWPGRMKRLIGPIVVQFAFYNLMETPLASEFPKLRWGFLETTGSDWLMGAVGALRRKGNKAVDKFLDEGRVFVCAEPTEDIEYMASKIGNDIFMVCTDLPHFDDAAHENPLEEFGSRNDIRAETMEKLLWSNASRFYDYAG